METHVITWTEVVCMGVTKEHLGSNVTQVCSFVCNKNNIYDINLPLKYVQRKNWKGNNWMSKIHFKNEKFVLMVNTETTFSVNVTWIVGLQRGVYQIKKLNNEQLSYILSACLVLISHLKWFCFKCVRVQTVKKYNNKYYLFILTFTYVNFNDDLDRFLKKIVSLMYLEYSEFFFLIWSKHWNAID